MHVSGLKSITAKHLALCSQSILFFAHLQEHISGELLNACPQAKRTILQPELDRLKQVGSALSGQEKREVVVVVGSVYAFGWDSFKVDWNNEGESADWRRSAQGGNGVDWKNARGGVTSSISSSPADH